MKKGRGSVAALIIVIVAAVYISVMFKDDVDRFSPFLTEEDVYVQVNQPGVLEHGGKIRYKLTAYNKEGKKEKISFTADVELPKGTYLKVEAKGTYVFRWEKIKAEEVPSVIVW